MPNVLLTKLSPFRPTSNVNPRRVRCKHNLLPGVPLPLLLPWGNLKFVNWALCRDRVCLSSSSTKFTSLRRTQFNLCLQLTGFKFTFPRLVRWVSNLQYDYSQWYRSSLYLVHKAVLLLQSQDNATYLLLYWWVWEPCCRQLFSSLPVEAFSFCMKYLKIQ